MRFTQLQARRIADQELEQIRRNHHEVIADLQKKVAALEARIAALEAAP